MLYRAILLLAPLMGADERGFRSSLRPLLDKYCQTCHSAKSKAGNLDLEQFRSAASVLAQQDVLDKAAAKIKSGEMPPKGMPAPSLAERQAALAWLRKEYARYDKSMKPEPGRVTARRLNRAEYNNTIRDLIGLDLRPADAFPADDSGYGFDNIGDVLSLSPALMEKYVAAASRIARAAIAIPRTYREAAQKYRADRIKPSGPDGHLEIRHTVPVEGDYDLRIGLIGRRPEEKEAITLTASVDADVLRTANVFTPQNQPRIHEIATHLKPGEHLLRAELRLPDGKPVVEEPLRGLTVEYIEIRGPRNPVRTPPPSHDRILVCGQWPGNYDDACLERIVSNFARRAYRRPPAEAETGKLLSYVRNGATPEEGIRYAIEAVLVSPHFLFRIEQDAGTAVHPVNEFELASRLSYFLWSSMPDEALFDLAARGQLRKPGVLEAQVRRMIGDARFTAFTGNFLGQWLALRNLSEWKPAPEKFPGFDSGLRTAMRRETELFFESLVRDNLPVSDLLDARYTFLNERLAQHYRIAGITGAEFRRVELDTPQRGGVLTHASVLTVSSYPTRTSPVLRGKYVMENILNAPPPPPPPNVPSLEESTKGSGGTLRQQMERHRADAACAACHLKMDALGFGLENYDAIGAWRDTDGGQPIDAKGALPGERGFDSPAELRRLLAENKAEFAQCITEKMLIYALGRGLERHDRPVIRRILNASEADRFRIQRLILEIAQSAPFQMRRPEGGKSK